MVRKQLLNLETNLLLPGSLEDWKVTKKKVIQQAYQIVSCLFTISDWLQYYDKAQITFFSTECINWWSYDH